ncbi:MFS transporter [Exidia glandulosa HHB12029]|uniref:MFS transporter n=1 Tax=Exidia glandulosa HHB12029 TaxID=1314781 RepID=A0A165DWS5_EXIGL|nr:MFS transporter [Exidia glandulosa HHB12029]
MSSSYTPYPPPSTGLNERRRHALEDVDNAVFSWFHVRVCLVAGIGFFTDAYDLFAINIAATMLGFVYGDPTTGQLGKSQDFGIKLTRGTASPIGTFFGQLLFGWLADLVGRKRMYVSSTHALQLCIIIVGTLGQAVSGEGPAASIVGVIIMWRIIMGVGIGGDYPLSAVISSEFAATRTRGRLMTAVFASQGFGNLAASVIAVIVVAAFRKSILADSQDNHKHVDFCWRLLLGLGCVPGAIALYFRLTIPETPRFTMDVERNLLKATQDVDEFIKQTETYIVDPDAPMKRIQAPLATRRDFLQHFSRLENAKILFAAAYSWFALDIAFYGLGLNSSVILEHVFLGPGGELLDSTERTRSENVYKILSGVSTGNVVLSIAGLIPGYWVAFFVIDRWGRKPIQLLGFGMLFIIFLIMGFAYHPILDHSPGVFMFLYCLANFFENFGPNTTTFIVPGEAFPTRYRSTAHGICAASGKFGAIIAQVAFNYLKDKGDGKGDNRDARLDLILKIFAFFMLSGVFSTLLLPETMGKSLEEISNENQHEFATYGAGAPSSAVRGPYLFVIRY